MPTVTVIIPVYKVERYLDACVESVVRQSYADLEILLVDDGSPDRCPALCDAWAEKDPRIKVIHRENGGLSAARNSGIDAAKGEFLLFVDSDDLLEPDAVRRAVDAQRQQDADLVIFNLTYVDEANRPLPQPDFSGFTDEILDEDGVWQRCFSLAETRIYYVVAWNKLYRRQMVDGVRFPTSKKIDDEFFTYRVLGNANTLIHSTKVCYAYRQQSESVMHSMPISKRIQAVEAKTQRHTYIKNHFPELTDLSARDLWFTCIYQGQLALRELDAGAVRSTMADLTTVLKETPIPMQTCNAKEKLWLILARKDIRLACRVRNILKIGL
mgnify:CR=1 FL=1